MLLDITPKMLKSNRTGTRLIGIHGPAGVGKDTLALAIQEQYSYNLTQIRSFAAPLKRATQNKYGLTDEAIWGNAKEDIHPFWGISSRVAQQFEGTEATRDIIHPDFWLARFIGALDGIIESYHMPVNEQTVVVIPDLRFQNEYDMLVNNNAMIIDMSKSPVHRPIKNGIANHRSETTLNLHAKDQTYEVINDGNLTQLREKASWILEQSMKHRV